jgi:hypothetical protein
MYQTGDWCATAPAIEVMSLSKNPDASSHPAANAYENRAPRPPTMTSRVTNQDLAAGLDELRVKMNDGTSISWRLALPFRAP